MPYKNGHQMEGGHRMCSLVPEQGTGIRSPSLGSRKCMQRERHLNRSSRGRAITLRIRLAFVSANQKKIQFSCTVATARPLGLLATMQADIPTGY